MIRKILLSLNALILAILLTITPVTRAHAALPLVLPVGGAIATGVYVTGALTVAGLATVMGIEHGDEIREHAIGVWDGATDLAKQSLDESIALWENGVMPLGEGMFDYVMSQVPYLVSAIYGQKNPPSTITDQVSIANSTGGGKTANILVNYNGITQIHVNGIRYRDIQISARADSSVHTLWGTLHSTGVKIAIKQIPYNQGLLTTLSSPISVTQAASLGSLFGVSIFLSTATATFDESIYNSGVSSLQETWTDMKDAGLVLPEAGLTAYTGDILVNHNAASGEWVGIDGNVYNPSDLSWKLPIPKVRTGTADIPSGTYVDSPALTGNPAIDQPLLQNPAIPKTTTNVETGVTYANPDIAIETPVETPVETPGLNPPKNPSKTISMVPLIIAGETLTTKFPFSLPWDMIRQLSVFDVEPEAPVFEVDIQNYLTFAELGISIPFKMDIDLTFLDPVAAIARWGTIIAFDIALILMLRRLLPE